MIPLSLLRKLKCPKKHERMLLRWLYHGRKKLNTLTPPPPPPPPPNISVRRNMALGTFFIFGGLIYYWNTNGDLLDGGTLEDPVQGIPAPVGPVIGGIDKGMSVSQKIRKQIEEEKQKQLNDNYTNSKKCNDGKEGKANPKNGNILPRSDEKWDIKKLTSELQDLRTNEQRLRNFLKSNDDGGEVCTKMKQRIKEIENIKRSIKKDIKEKQNGKGQSSLSFIFERV